MSEKQRHKKDGEDKGKSLEAMRDYEKTGELPGEGRHESDAEKLAKVDRADFDKDLRPHEGEGQNLPQNNDTPRARNAYDIKDLHEKFPALSNADLKQLAILPVGTRLEQGATYLDLNDPATGEFKVRADRNVGEHSLLVAKQDVDYELWDRLRGHGERVGGEDVGAASSLTNGTDDVPNDQTSVDESKVDAS